ncbi:RdgB/HAM1 family non-canonical purine NTP pyrophosphatase [candidate division FCPU426 bacterium]|nr:RdgB/HAM1 family non-canonical purine NTP pyrophosphatase [candidate division FCPU426 bacterium]
MGVNSRAVLVAATNNKHKLYEIKGILRKVGLEVRPLSDYPPLPPVMENGRTLHANAAKKAEAVARALWLPALADDSGLFVPVLKGKPGVRSARFAGPACDYQANNRKLLRSLKRAKGKERQAYFAAVMAFSVPGRKTVLREGRVWGRITEKPAGENGFGYDPVFIPRGETKTFAQLRPARKNQLSHRYRALKKIAAVIAKNWDTILNSGKIKKNLGI